MLRAIRAATEAGRDACRARHVPLLDAKHQRASAAALGLFFHLTSGADLHSPDELAAAFTEAGFGKPKRTKVRRIPDQGLYQARAV